MTKDDCINKIKNIKAYLTAGNPIWNTDEIAEACDMAIEALKNQWGTDVYKVTAKQVYYVRADTTEQAQLFFINGDEEHIGIGFTEVTSVEEVKGEQNE